jgi:hypothetical protein
MTLVEVMIAMGLGSLVLAAVSTFMMYGARSSVAVINYTDLDTKSRYALDVISREVRQANALIDYQPNLPVKYLTLTNSDQAASIKITFDSNAQTLTLEKTGQPIQTNLIGCDSWSFNLFQRTPLITGTNVMFYPATNSAGNVDITLCKLINLSWKCSRAILGNKINTESVQSAQIVLRNKQ